MVDEKFYEIIQDIFDNKLEFEVWETLNKIIIAKYQELDAKSSTQRACLRAIKKINNGKSDAIDSLCE